MTCSDRFRTSIPACDSPTDSYSLASCRSFACRLYTSRARAPSLSPIGDTALSVAPLNCEQLFAKRSEISRQWFWSCFETDAKSPLETLPECRGGNREATPAAQESMMSRGRSVDTSTVACNQLPRGQTACGARWTPESPAGIVVP